MLLDEEWLEHGFVGAMSWPAVLWAWDQCAISGWSALAEIAADSLWLLRRQIRRLDEIGGGADDLRDLFAKRLRAVPVAEFQALYAATHRPTSQPSLPKAAAEADMSSQPPASLPKAPLRSRPEVAFRLPLVAEGLVV
jgi:hypothetical protein